MPGAFRHQERGKGGVETTLGGYAVLEAILIGSAVEQLASAVRKLAEIAFNVMRLPLSHRC